MSGDFSGNDRRHSARNFGHQRAKLKRKGSQSPQSAQIMNISEGGARIVCAEKIPVGEEFDLDLKEGRRHCKALECKSLFDGFAIRTAFLS